MRFDRRRPPIAVALLSRAVDAVMTVAVRGRRMIKGYATVGRFAARGDDFEFDPDGFYSYEHIHVGNHVNLGSRPTILATRSEVRIGNHVLFGPGVTIRGGNHRIDLLGTYLDEVDDFMKRPQDDLGVVIEDDVWVGGNATILHGVTVGRGSVIGASAVVVTDIPPYSIAVGNPARVVRRRWHPAQDAEHEGNLAKEGSGSLG